MPSACAWPVERADDADVGETLLAGRFVLPIREHAIGEVKQPLSIHREEMLEPLRVPVGRLDAKIAAAADQAVRGDVGSAETARRLA